LPNDPNGDPSPNLKYISRAVVDPNNPNIAYITLSYYTPVGQGVFKTTNLNLTGSGTVTWNSAGNGIPSIPINAFVIDPSNSNRLFAGTDIGVYVSEDGGANWSPYGTGLPRVAVFDMAIQPTSLTLRIATHGRGMWEIPTSAQAAIMGRVNYSDTATGVRNVTMTLSAPSFTTRTTTTDTNGIYAFVNIPVGNNYVVTPSKTGDVNGIESLDASNVARYAAGLDIPTANQRIAADADGDGIVTSFDASLIARRTAGLPGTGKVGSWKFVPVNRTYIAFSEDQLNQNFTAILVGDTSDNWMPSVPAGGAAANSTTLRPSPRRRIGSASARKQ
jgi:hypothetical protein